ncbi:hypothetical protein B0H34DRAFT_798120 [Crassisporium funariophilum]|nr:hypothetical protein B0H34DRAFT_798120 [Crassisporium funariophilum]
MANNHNFRAFGYPMSLTEELNSPLTDVRFANLTDSRANMYTGSENQPAHNVRISSSSAHQHIPPAQPAHQFQDLQKILGSATHFALMASGNEAHDEEVALAPSSNNTDPPVTAADQVASSSHIVVSVTSLLPPETAITAQSTAIATPMAEHPSTTTPSIPSLETPLTNALTVSAAKSTTGDQLVMARGDVSDTMPSVIATSNNNAPQPAAGTSLSMVSTSQGEEAPGVVRSLRRVKLNPLAGLSIPKPPSEVSEPQSGTQSLLTVAVLKPKKGKLMEASGTLLTARNLYLIDYLKTHQDSEHPTVTEFREIYKKLDHTTVKQYEELSRERKAAAAKLPLSSGPSQENS